MRHFIFNSNFLKLARLYC